MIPNNFKSQEEYDFPNIVNVAVLRGSCPCECVHCPVGSTKKSERHERFGSTCIDLILFKKIVDQMKPFKHSILRIHAVGEPLLWDDLEKALTYAKLNGIKTWIFTSLITNKKNQLDTIANYSSIIEVSVNSIDKEEYKITKGVDAFDLVKDNISYISKIIKKFDLKTRVIASRVQTEDQGYDSKFVEYWKSSGLVDDSFIRSYHSYNGVIKDKGNKEIRDVLPCQVHWARFNIDTSGKAVICFNELFKGKEVNENVVLGDLKNESIQDIWHGKKLSCIRQAQIEGNYSKVDFTKELPCLKCKYCQPIGAKRITSEYQVKQVLAKC